MNKILKHSLPQKNKNDLCPIKTQLKKIVFTFFFIKKYIYAVRKKKKEKKKTNSFILCKPQHGNMSKILIVKALIFHSSNKLISNISFAKALLVFILKEVQFI